MNYRPSLRHHLKALLSEPESEAKKFYDTWIGGSRLVSILGRWIFRLSGIVYAGPFIRAGGVTPPDRVLEIGCGMGAILVATRRKLRSAGTYLGIIDLSVEMVNQAPAQPAVENPVSFVVASGLSLPLDASAFDVVLFSHVVKYLTDEQMKRILEEARRVLKPGGRVVLWEFNPIRIAPVTRLILKCCKAQKLRGLLELKQTLTAAGFRNLQPFRVITPWLPWSNIALAGSLRLPE